MGIFYTYVLESEQTGQLYIGQTQDYKERLERHNSDRNKWTKGKGPWHLLGYRSHSSRSEAIRLERKLKSWKNPQRVKAWLADNTGG